MELRENDVLRKGIDSLRRKSIGGAVGLRGGFHGSSPFVAGASPPKGVYASISVMCKRNLYDDGF